MGARSKQSKDYSYYMHGVYQKNKKLIPDRPYHIIQRAPGREQLFIEDSDHVHFLKILKEMTKKFDFEIRAFCLMPNHLHMLGLSKDKNFSDAMQYLFKRYAQYFNAKYNRKGHVFHGPFRVVPASSEKVEIIMSTYIHLNPVRARLVEDPLEWKWSSLELYFYPNRKSFVNPKPILSYISENLKVASNRYVRLLEEIKGKQVTTRLRGNLSKDVDSFLAKYFRNFVMCFRDGFFKKEYEVLSKLEDRVSRSWVSPFKKREAYLYAIDQLLAQGYSLDVVREILGIPRSTFYRYIRVHQEG